MNIVVFDVEGTLLQGQSLLLAARKSNCPAKLIWHIITFMPRLFRNY